VERPFDERMLAAIERDLPVTHRPFRQIAEEAGVGERDVLDALRRGLRAGVIRRYGALLAHRKVGFTANAMAAWRVPNDRIEGVGAAMASHERVTHCYQRPPFEGFPYTLYTMVHATSREEAMGIVRELAERTGVEKYEVLFSVREFKKDSPKYAGRRNRRGG
jgi:DNA-binding Lrp family transcriptional regulator